MMKNHLLYIFRWICIFFSTIIPLRIFFYHSDFVLGVILPWFLIIVSFLLIWKLLISWTRLPDYGLFKTITWVCTFILSIILIRLIFYSSHFVLSNILSWLLVIVSFLLVFKLLKNLPQLPARKLVTIYSGSTFYFRIEILYKRRNAKTSQVIIDIYETDAYKDMCWAFNIIIYLILFIHFIILFEGIISLDCHPLYAIINTTKLCSARLYIVLFCSAPFFFNVIIFWVYELHNIHWIVLCFVFYVLFIWFVISCYLLLIAENLWDEKTWY